MNPCRRVLPLLEAFCDGELAADQVVEVEQHLVDCELCCERIRLATAIRTSTRRVVRDSVEVSDAFRERISRALSAEEERVAQRSARERQQRPLGWRSIVPLSAAASFALMIAAAKSERSQEPRPTSMSGHFSSAAMTHSSPTAGVDQLLDEFVEHHAHPDRPAVTEPGLLPRLEPEVGVPVRLPLSLKHYGARWEGADVVPSTSGRNQHAASLRYRVGDERITLYVYDSARFPLRAKLEPRVVRDMPVYIGSRRGYSIAAIEKRGVGYAVTGALDDRESAELVVASLH